MSLKDLKSRSDEALASIPQTPDMDRKPVRPTTAPGATALMQPTIDALKQRTQEAEAKAVELEKRLERQPIEVLIDQLVEVPSRKRRLTPEEFNELKENLANNPLMHPVAVKKLGNGTFEVVSGHNRVAAYKALGRKAIEVVVKDIEDASTDRLSFYTNLLQPSLPDFEKYLGFKAEKERSGYSQKQIAQEAGVPEAVVSMLFSFGELPGRALEVIERRPEAIGMKCVMELVKLVRGGKTDRVVEAIELLVEGKLTQKEAVSYAGRSVTPQTRVRTSPIKIRAGRLDFCQYVGHGTSLRIEFKNEEHRTQAEDAIGKLLQELAEQVRRT